MELVQLPSYTPADAALFDDHFHEAIFLRKYWRPDDKLRDRVRRAEAVVVARITTAAEQPTRGGAPNVIVELRPYGQPLFGSVPDGPLLLTLPPNSPSYRLFRNQLRTMLGRDVVLFYRRYTQDGEARIHFRAEPNFQDVHLAVQRVVLSSPAPQRE